MSRHPGRYISSVVCKSMVVTKFHRARIILNGVHIIFLLKRKMPVLLKLNGMNYSCGVDLFFFNSQMLPRLKKKNDGSWG